MLTYVTLLTYLLTLLTYPTHNNVLSANRPAKDYKQGAAEQTSNRATCIRAAELAGCENPRLRAARRRTTDGGRRTADGDWRWSTGDRRPAIVARRSSLVAAIWDTHYAYLLTLLTLLSYSTYSPDAKQCFECQSLQATSKRATEQPSHQQPGRRAGGMRDSETPSGQTTDD